MKLLKFLALTTLVGAFFYQCESGSEQKAQENTKMQASEKNRIVLYQMMTRLFGNTNSTNKEWGTRQENGVGKFDDISSTALKAIRDMGYTHVWYTGALEHALVADYTEYGIPLDDADVIKGRAGSPYAIKDYYDVNPDLAVKVPNRLAEFEKLVQRTHKNNLKVIIDFVPNHVAREYRSDQKPEGVSDFGAEDDTTTSFAANNNFYYIPGTSFKVPADYVPLGDHAFPTKDGKFHEVPAKVSGNNVFNPSPDINDWFETVKLNYGVDYQNNSSTFFEPVPDTWLKMKDILLYWAGKDVDGFRCDMAEMVPVEFWNWVTQEVRNQYPDIIFIAEIYNPNNYRNYILTGGFDYLYDKVELYDTLKHIVQKTATTDDITAIWQRQEGIGDNMLRFLENHDEQRIASPYFAGNMWKGIPMMAVTSFMHKGPVMMYFGQDVGEPGAGVEGFSGNDGRTTIFDYWGVPEHIKWVNGGKFDGKKLSQDQISLQQEYIKILKAVNDIKAIRKGGFYDLHFYNRNDKYEGYSNEVFAFIRHTVDDVRLIVVNFAEESKTTNIKVPIDAWRIFGVTADKIAYKKDEAPVTVQTAGLTDYESDMAISVEIPALSYQIVELKPKQ